MSENNMNLDAAARNLADAQEAMLRADIAHRDAAAFQRQAEREYKDLHAQMHPPPMLKVVVPEGMKHVGWYCEHGPLVKGQRGWAYTPHRTPCHKNKRGWTESTNTSSSLRHGGPITQEEAEKHCQYSRPLFVTQVVE